MSVLEMVLLTCKPIWGFPGGSVVKNPPAMQETWVQSLGREDLWSRAQQPIPEFLTGESHGQRNLAGYRPWGHKESNMTAHTASTVNSEKPQISVAQCVSLTSPRRMELVSSGQLQGP